MRYVIIAPTYNQKTAGIAVLQELQKWLIKSGKDAIIPNININAPYAIQDDDIVVYPEIIPGNPLNAKRVVRYILNVPGKLGGTAKYDSNEILVAYTKEWSRYSNGVYLQIPIIEEFFTNKGLERTIDCFWVGKGQNTHHPATRGCIEITYQWPAKRRELAELLNRTRIFYSYDDCTHLLAEAMLCGCTVKLISNDELVDSIQSPFPDKEEFQRQLNQFIKLTWYPEMDSSREAAENIDSVISHHSSILATWSKIPHLTSIVILTFNELKYTRECIESIRKHTPEPHEVIFVDNASTDGTLKWLRKHVQDNTNYRLIENEKNLGFAKGCNQGIEAATGEYILLLNNDVVVTENWLAGMLECLNSAADTGIVGPMTNSISGPQKVREVDYKSIGRLNDYAKSFRERYRYRRIPLQRIVGFCMLFRHQLTDQIGLLDQSFGTGNFEDDDYCLRSTLAGYRNLIAGDVFIHHYGSRSFIGNRIDYSSSMTGNIKIFDEKWSGIAVDSPLGKKVVAFNFIEKADKLHQRGQLDKAIAMLIEGIKYAPEEKDLYYNLAEMLLDEKQYKDALEAVNSMLPEAKDDLRRLGIIAYCTEELEDAEKQADRILGIDQACAPAWNLKGLIANKKGDDDAAEGYFVQAIALDPSYGAPYTNRGMLQWTSDHKEEALDLLEKGFILSSLSTDSVTLYHSAITALEQFERAEKIFRDAKELHPENKRILFFLIDMLINQGKFEKAMREVERAMPDIGIDDGMLPAALALRDKVGIKEIDKALKSKGTLSLCMIVKNEEKHLARCLLNAGPAADEMIVVDTGSTDRTMDIARAYGARVFDFEWTHDFSEARNHSLENASGDWILVLDADEVISPQDYSEFEKIMKNRPSRPVAYTMITRNYTYEVTAKGWTANDRKYLREEAGTGWFPSAKVRLFVNDKRIRFQNPVHEFVEASLEKARIEIKISSIPVHHYGRFDKDKIIEKGKKYFLLGKKKIEEMKGDIKALKELAIQATELGEYDTSVELWKEAIKLDQGHADVFFNMGYAYLKLNKYQEALDASRRATELDPSLKEAAINYAGGEFLIGDIKKAISIVEALLQKHPDYPPATLLLATAYYVQDQKEKGLGLFEKLRKRGFNWTDFLDEQSRALISLERLDQAMLLLEAAVKTGNINKDTDSLLAELQSRIR